MCSRSGPPGPPSEVCRHRLTSILRKFSDSMIDTTPSDVVIYGACSRYAAKEDIKWQKLHFEMSVSNLMRRTMA